VFEGVRTPSGLNRARNNSMHATLRRALGSCPSLVAAAASSGARRLCTVAASPAGGRGGAGAGTSGAGDSTAEGTPRAPRARGRGAAAAGAGLKGRFTARRRLSTPAPRPSQQQPRAPREPQAAPLAHPPTAAAPEWFSEPAVDRPSSPGGASAGSSQTQEAAWGGAVGPSGSQPAGRDPDGRPVAAAEAGESVGGRAGSTQGAVAAELARLSPSQRRQLNDYLDYLLEINQSMNLTGEGSIAGRRHPPARSSRAEQRPARGRPPNPSAPTPLPQPSGSAVKRGAAT
jgi:hypothetical protein